MGDGTGLDEMGTTTPVAAPITRLAWLSHATSSDSIERPFLLSSPLPLTTTIATSTATSTTTVLVCGSFVPINM